jgi:hypothetical protein
MMSAAGQAATKPMRAYSIDLPGHVVRFSLPEEIAREMGPLSVEKRFDPLDPAYFRNGFREIAGTMHDFKGPVWVGTIGSLKFHFMVQRRRTEYKDEITTTDGLDRYVHWWNGKIEGRATGCVFSLTTLNGMPAVRREWKSQAEYLEIFSLPLNEGMFLDVGFNVREWISGHASKWKKKAEEMREAIKATVVLEKK